MVGLLSGSTLYALVYGSNKYFKIISNKTKKILQEQLHKYLNMWMHNEHDSITSWHKITLDGLTYH